MRRYGSMIMMLILLAGCSTRFAERTPSPVPSDNFPERTFAALPPPEEVWLPLEETAAVQPSQPPEEDVLSKLYPYQKQWHRIPYRYGGTGACGIDCSAFVQQAYRELFGIELPRTAQQQALCGRAVSERQIQAGDLVFFRTGGRNSHVGIYLEGGSFMHVSASRGVMISSLDKPYWKRHYWKARRVK